MTKFYPGDQVYYLNGEPCGTVIRDQPGWNVYVYLHVRRAGSMYKAFRHNALLKSADL